MIIPDTSFYQYKWKDWTYREIIKAIDFGKMRTHTPAVILRAGQSTWRDPALHHSWKAAKAAGLLRGSYFFFDSRTAPKRQAEEWAAAIGDDLPEMECWADFEDRYGGAWSNWEAWYDFMEYSKELMPATKFGVYTGFYYFKEFANTPKAKNYFKQYDLWIAAYNTTAPKIPPPFEKWLYWQYTDNGDGELYGVQSLNIDLNYFNGTEAEFMTRYGAVESPKARLTARFGDTIAEYKER